MSYYQGSGDSDAYTPFFNHQRTSIFDHKPEQHDQAYQLFNKLQKANEVQKSSILSQLERTSEEEDQQLSQPQSSSKNKNEYFAVQEGVAEAKNKEGYNEDYQEQRLEENLQKGSKMAGKISLTNQPISFQDSAMWLKRGRESKNEKTITLKNSKAKLQIMNPISQPLNLSDKLLAKTPFGEQAKPLNISNQEKNSTSIFKGEEKQLPDYMPFTADNRQSKVIDEHTNAGDLQRGKDKIQKKKIFLGKFRSRLMPKEQEVEESENSSNKEELSESGKSTVSELPFNLHVVSDFPQLQQNADSRFKVPQKSSHLFISGRENYSAGSKWKSLRQKMKGSELTEEKQILAREDNGREGSECSVKEKKLFSSRVKMLQFKKGEQVQSNRSVEPAKIHFSCKESEQRREQEHELPVKNDFKGENKKAQPLEEMKGNQVQKSVNYSDQQQKKNTFSLTVSAQKRQRCSIQVNQSSKNTKQPVSPDNKGSASSGTLFKLFKREQKDVNDTSGKQPEKQSVGFKEQLKKFGSRPTEKRELKSIVQRQSTAMPKPLEPQSKQLNSKRESFLIEKEGLNQQGLVRGNDNKRNESQGLARKGQSGKAQSWFIKTMMTLGELCEEVQKLKQLSLRRRNSVWKVPELERWIGERIGALLNASKIDK